MTWLGVIASGVIVVCGGPWMIGSEVTGDIQDSGANAGVIYVSGGQWLVEAEEPVAATQSADEERQTEEPGEELNPELELLELE